MYSCHNAGTTSTVAPSVEHADGNIDVANVGYLANKTKGSAGTTCSAASCHVSPVSTAFVTTPSWGVTGAGCVACHSGVNAITANGPATGSHTNTVGHAVACTLCHAAGTTSTVAPSVANGHTDGNIDVVGVGYLANKTKGSAGTTCSAASCHVSPVSTAFVTTPSWGVTGAGCVACHSGVNAITANGPATGSHTNTPGHAVACTTCHNAGTTSTVAPSVEHADGNIDVANVGYLANKTKGSAGTTCSAASCHVSPVSTAFVTTPSWGVTGAGCVACHSGVNAITANGPATGSHTNTPGHAVACTTCHNAGTTSTVAPSVEHADGNIDVANVGYLANKTKGSAGTTCSAASCHVSPVSTAFVTTPSWGVTGAGCVACHSGVNAITANGPATGSHTNTPGHAVACTTCHAAGTTSTIAPSAANGHADGNIDVANVGYLANKTKGSAGTTCSAASCHVSPVSTAFVTTPSWGVTGVGCAACHNGANLITAQGPATGSHTKHATAPVATVCTDCHNAGTSATVAPTVGHIDGNIDATQGYPANKVKASAAATCTTLCHSTSLTAVVTPTWGQPSTCASCHATSPATGAHNAHLLTTTFNKTIACIDCHAGAVSGSNGGTAHLDGNIDVAAGGYPTNIAKHAVGTYAGTCSATWCHGSAVSPFGTPILPADAVTPKVVPTWGATITGCTACHGNPPNDTNHTGVAVNTCNQCHAHVNSTNTFNDPTQHVDGKVQGGSCDYCHGYPPVKSLTNAYGPVGRNANYSSARLENYSGGGGVHDVAGHLPVTLKESQGTRQQKIDACKNCHGDTFAAGLHNTAQATFGAFSTKFVQVVVDPKFKFDKNRPIVYNGNRVSGTKTSGTCANVECHFQKSPKWEQGTYGQGH